MKVVNPSQSINPFGRLHGDRVATKPNPSPINGGQGTSVELEKLPAPMFRPLPGRYELHRFWAQLGSLQQQATAVQITMRSLLLVKLGLRDMKQLFAAVKEAGTFKGWSIRLQEQKRLIARIPMQAHYQGLRLLTQEFRPPLLGYQDVREFRITGFNLLTPSGRDEHLELILLGGRPVRVGLCIKGDSAYETRLRQVGRAFARLGMRSHPHGDDNMLFNVPIEQWKAINGQLYIRGGGGRVPTGEPIKLKLEPDISWREISHWKLTDEQDLELAASRILQLESEIDSHFFLLQRMQGSWLGQLQTQPNDLEQTQLAGLLSRVQDRFSSAIDQQQQLALFTTQANLHKDSVHNILTARDEQGLAEPI